MNLFRTLTIFILLTLLFTSCGVRIYPKKIVFSEEKQLYEYGTTKYKMDLRDEQLRVVDTTNFDDFEKELESNGYRYRVDRRSEKDYYLRRSDVVLAGLYRDANKAITLGNYANAIRSVNSLVKMYPEVSMYSDCAFLKGYAFERLGDLDSALFQYERFLTYSTQKYSARFRGNVYLEPGDENFIKEREYARLSLAGKAPTTLPGFPIITPRYYYGSFQPGYSINTHDAPVGNMLLIMIMSDLTQNLGLGLDVYMKINRIISLDVVTIFSPGVMEFALASPLQLFLSETHNMGIKLTPFISFARISEVGYEGEVYEMKENWPNFGARISAGYYPFHKVSIGAYYQVSYFNENNWFQLENDLAVWKPNKYDVSLYYNIWKGFSLKTGIKNGDWVAGFYMNGWEFGFNITDPGFVMDVELY